MLTIVGLSHAEDVTNRATRGVAYNDDSAMQEAIADDAAFTVVLSIIHDLDRCAGKDQSSVFEVQAALGEGLVALGGIVGDAHEVIVSTITGCGKAASALRAAVLHNVLAQWRPKAVRWSAGLGTSIPQDSEKQPQATKDSRIQRDG